MMKKIQVLFCCVVITSFAMAQDDGLKPFKFEISLGFASSGGTGVKHGMIVVYEPKYAVRPDLALGLRIESVFGTRFGGYNSRGEKIDMSMSLSNSFLATCDHYFKNKYSFRPFAGVGLGLFNGASALFDISSRSLDAKERLGFQSMMRIGFEAEHFRFGIEYNIAPATTLDSYDANRNPAIVESRNSYLGVKIGACIGGGPRKR